VSLENFYQRLPITLQQLACNLHGWRIQRSRYAKAFWTELETVEARGRKSQEEVCAFRDGRLRAFVRHAAETSPYYRDVFGRLGITPEDIRTLDDMQALPILTKAQVQDAPEMFLSTAIPKRLRVQAHTSGTTGGGLRFATTLRAQQEQWATWWRYWRCHGLQPGTWCGYFGGRSVVPITQKSPPFWRINHPGRQILFSAYHTSPDNLTHYLDELRRRRPPWLHGYPSQLALIASHMADIGYDLGYRPQWITVGAENLLPHQVTIIKAAFGREPIQHYGMAEAVANISQCEAGKLHVDEDFAAVEFLPSGIEGTCRIVGTNFSNPATPLLRYEVGDHAQISGKPCPCGRASRILTALDGRQEDYVLTRSGARVGRLDHIFKDLVNVREAQIRQFRPSEIRVSIVKSPAYNDRDETALRREFESRLGADMEVNVSYVEKLERTKQGKLRFVVSEIPAGANSEFHP
jgi:phenylacetate-CoA ligase